jgi:hypothetical protein
LDGKTELRVTYHPSSLNRDPAWPGLFDEDVSWLSEYNNKTQKKKSKKKTKKNSKKDGKRGSKKGSKKGGKRSPRPEPRRRWTCPFNWPSRSRDLPLLERSS